MKRPDAMIHRPYRALSRLLLTALLALALIGVSACEDQALDETERNEFYKTIRTGVEHPEDAYVRAETLRVMELVRDPSLNEFAERLLSDPSPMVRVAAIRVLLATEHDEARTLTLNLYNSAGEEARRAILTAALDYGSEPLQRELTGRAIRSDDPELRRRAFERGYLARIDKARAENDLKYLERTLYPELTRFVEGSDPLLASLALGKFYEVGQPDWDELLKKRLADDKGSLDQRLFAARVLTGAYSMRALPIFEKIVDRYDRLLKDSSLGVPDKIVPPPLLRAAILGAVAGSNTELVTRARAYLQNADVRQSIDVLEALARNPSPDAALTLKIAMQDARTLVRHRAIELYQVREDADPKALIAAMKGAPMDAQRQLSNILLERYRDAWVEHLGLALKRSSEMAPTLELLRNVIQTPEQASILTSLRDELQALVDEGKEKRAPIAAYLLALVSEGEARTKLVSEKLDDATRYAYLQFLVTTEPKAHAETFRRYFYSDLFVVRLISAAGLWAAYAPAEGQVAEGEEEAEAPADDEEPIEMGAPLAEGSE